VDADEVTNRFASQYFAWRVATVRQSCMQTINNADKDVYIQKPAETAFEKLQLLCRLFEWFRYGTLTPEVY
jgi:hypothetical protein